MNLRFLETFLWVARLNSFSATAERLHTTQAAVSNRIAALERERPGAAALVRRAPDPAVEAIVRGWPAAFRTARAAALGFSPHEPLGDVVRAFIEDDLAETRSERNPIPG